jgi:leader peptidase (prepilin peptidase) / N-methyltransferase
MIMHLGQQWAQNPWVFWLVLAACLYFAVVGVRLSVVDLRSHLLPNRIIFPSYGVAAAVLGLAAAAGQDWARLLTMAVAAVVLWVGYFVLRVIYPQGMGFGDVKLAALLGLYLGYLGWNHVLWGTFAAFLLGGLWGAALILARRATAKSRIAFGPFMILGAAAAMALP